MSAVFTYRLLIYLGLLAVVLAGLADIACPATTSADPAPITLTLDKHQGFGPLDVRAYIRVTPHPDNRAVCVFVNGPLKETSSCFPHLPTDTSQRSVRFVDLRGGEYAIWAVLLREGNKDGIASVAATVNIQ